MLYVMGIDEEKIEILRVHPSRFYFSIDSALVQREILLSTKAYNISNGSMISEETYLLLLEYVKEGTK
ncbi:MAG TPA: hypothetical protein VIK72_15100 [Clostridiaceae bacterium]